MLVLGGCCAGHYTIRVNWIALFTVLTLTQFLAISLRALQQHFMII